MNQPDSDFPDQTSEPAVDQDVLTEQIERQERMERGYDPISSEPVLKEHLYEEMLKVCGKMALCGAPSEVVRGVRSDMERLLDLTIASFKAAMDKLWADFLPTADAQGLKVNRKMKRTSPGPDPTAS